MVSCVLLKIFGLRVRVVVKADQDYGKSLIQELVVVEAQRQSDNRNT